MVLRIPKKGEKEIARRRMDIVHGVPATLKYEIQHVLLL